MAAILEGFLKAFSLILSLDRELLGIIFLSLKVSGLALVIASCLGLPLGALMGLRKFPLRGALISAMNTLMGLPPVVAGLLLYLLLSRSGPLGFMGLLYSPKAMVLAQSLLCFPIVASLSHTAISSVDPIVRQASLTLGATPFQASLALFREARYGVLSAIIAALGRAMAEVGAILVVGGNIAGYTRVMTTTIALETDKGNFELALALGVILLMISLVINASLYTLQRKGRRAA